MERKMFRASTLVFVALLFPLTARAHASPQYDLAFTRNGQVWVANVTENREQQLTRFSPSGPRASRPFWVSESTIGFIATPNDDFFGNSNTAHTVTLAGAQGQLWEPADRRVAKFGGVQDVAVSPDGSSALISLSSTNRDYLTIHSAIVFPLSGDRQTPVVHQWTNVHGFWQVDWTQGDAYVMEMWGDGAQLGRVEPDTNDSYVPLPDIINGENPVWFDVTPDGGLIAYVSYGWNRPRIEIVVRELPSGREVMRKAHRIGTERISISADGKHVAVSETIPSETVRVLEVPGGAQVVTLDNARDAKFSSAVGYSFDSGFRPETDGYGFRNGTDLVRDDDWDVWKYVFGGGPWSWTRYQFHNSIGDGLFGGGICCGFATSANTVWQGTNDVAGFPASPRDVASVEVSHDSKEFGQAQPEVVREFIERYHLSQLMSGYTGLTRYGTRAVYEHLRQVFESGSRDIPALILKEKLFGSGHVVTPFAMTGPIDDVATIWVWDNNHPGQARPLYVSTASWGWTFDLLREGEREGKPAITWSSANGWLEYIPTSDTVSLMHKTPGGSGIVPEEKEGFFEGLLASVTMVSSNAEPLFQDASGAQAGILDGEAVDDIEGIDYLYPDIWSEPTSRVFFVEGNADLTREVAMPEAGSYSYIASDDSGAVQVEATGDAGTDIPELDTSEGRLDYTAGSDKDALDLTLYRPLDESVRILAATETTLAAEEAFEVAATDGDRGFTLRLAGDSVHTYVPMLAVAGETTFTAEAQSIAPGEQHTITADDWDDLSSANIILAIDEDADGEDDAYIALQGEVPPSDPEWLLPVTIAGALILAIGGGFLLWRKRKR